MTLALASPKVLGLGLAALVGLLALGKSSKAATPLPGSVPSPTDMPIAERMARVLASRDPAAIRFEAGRLRLEGYPAQAVELETAAAKLEAEMAAGQAPPVVRIPPGTVTSPGLPQLPSLPLPPILIPVPAGGGMSPPSPPAGVLTALPNGVVLKNGKPNYPAPGSSGPLVAAWQVRLVSLGFPVGAAGVDSVFGDSTEAATRLFQTAANVALKAAGKPTLSVDGQVGPATLAAALTAKLGPSPAPVGLPVPVLVPPAVAVPATVPLPAPPPAIDLKGVVLKNGKPSYPAPGSSGSLVSLWQLKLLSLGFSVGSKGADGIFGDDTDAATRAFQTAANLDAVAKGQPTLKLTVDGKVGPDTVKRAFSAAAIKAPSAPAVSSTPKPVVLPPTAPVAAPTAPFVLPSGTILQNGSSGPLVKSWQAKLISLGFSVGPKGADGSYGADTTTATKAFQTASNAALKAGAPKLTVDGKVGPATVARANVAKVGPSPATAPASPQPATPLFGAIPAMAPAEPSPKRALAARLTHALFSAEEQGLPLGSEDTSLVRLFQATEGQKASGFYGPGTAVVLAGRYGIVPPKPLYWPSTGTTRSKQNYREQLASFAAMDPQRAEEWIRAAAV